MTPQTVRCSVASIDVSPALPVAMAGFHEGRDVPATDRDGRLECNLILLGFGATRVLLASFDLLYPGSIARGAVLSGVGDLLPTGAVVTFASHSHYAPATDPDKPDLGAVDPRYERLMRERVSSAVAGLLRRDAAPASVRVGQVQLNHSVSRRLRRMRLDRNLRLTRTVRMAPNRRGPRDEVATVCVFEEGDRPLAVIWNYACHPTSYPSPRTITPDFPGIVRSSIRRQLAEPDLPVLFLQGFSGDVRPPFRSSVRGIRGVLDRVLQGPRVGLPSPEQYGEWAESLADGVCTAVRTARADQSPRLAYGRAEVPLSEFVVDTPPPAGTVPFAAIRLGPALIAGVGSEPVSEYARWIRDRHPDLLVMPAGCMDDTYGYTPTSAMQREGGYEVVDHCLWFGYRSLSPGCDAALRRGLLAAVAASRGT